jgi:NAD(P)-dependent dehydrogenase (short-subunit alcohol dehydrogenase family)
LGGFEGKVVLVTGASSGIGEALAREFARQGARLALVGRRADRLAALEGDIRGSGGEALAIPGDVTRDGDLERAVAAAVERFGRLDVAVANAGFGVAGPLARLTLDDYRRQFETNVFGVLRTAYASLEALARSRGTLVLVGSVTAWFSTPGGSAYAMSKAAVRALADALHGELEPRGIRTVLVSPGYVESQIRQVDNQGRLHPDAPDRVPRWLAMPAAAAARRIVRAVARRRRNAVITGHGKAIVFLSRHLPWLAALAARRLGRRRARSPGARGARSA